MKVKINENYNERNTCDRYISLKKIFGEKDIYVIGIINSRVNLYKGQLYYPSDYLVEIDDFGCGIVTCPIEYFSIVDEEIPDYWEKIGGTSGFEVPPNQIDDYGERDTSFTFFGDWSIVSPKYTLFYIVHPVGGERTLREICLYEKVTITTNKYKQNKGIKEGECGFVVDVTWPYHTVQLERDEREIIVKRYEIKLFEGSDAIILKTDKYEKIHGVLAEQIGYILEKKLPYYIVRFCNGTIINLEKEDFEWDYYEIEKINCNVPSN